jgi:Uma2 family endonuclease
MLPISHQSITFDENSLATISLLIPHDLTLKVSHEEFVKLAEANRELRLERTAQGELIVNPPTGWETGERNMRISGELYLWWRNVGKPGKIFDSSTAFTLPNGADRSPDASWVSQSGWDALTDDHKQTFASVCPDFVVELRSRSDSLKTLQEKMQEYRDNGARLGWLIDPKNRRVEIYRQGQEAEVISQPDTLSGEDVLSGFELQLDLIW